MRLPRPIAPSFFDFLSASFSPKYIINRPSGMLEVGSKKFLLQVKNICPPMKWCTSMEEITDFAKRFPIVLKPLENYGGKGIVKIEDGIVYVNKEHMSLNNYMPFLQKELENGGYLAMKFLKNVHQGDKRIIVVNGQILGASLRLPPPDSWMCNVAQGGSSHLSKADADEQHIIDTIKPILKQKGVVMYGVDTLVNDDGKRVLSEVNTLSIGGLPQAEAQSGIPIVQQAVNLIFEHIETVFDHQKQIV